MQDCQDPQRTCYNCLNLKQRGPSLIGCEILKFEKIYYPRWRGTLSPDFKKKAKSCKNYIT